MAGARIVQGPCAGRGFHTHDEYIELPTLLSKAEALARYLDALA